MLFLFLQVNTYFSSMETSADLANLFPRRLLEKYRAFPQSIEGNKLRMLMENPEDGTALDYLSFSSSLKIVPVKAEKTAIQEMLTGHVSKKSDFEQTAFGLAEDMKRSRIDESVLNTVDDLKKSGQAEPVVKMVDLILDEAIKAGASDVHIEPQEDGVAVRNRVDGLLRKTTELPRWMHAALTSRIKILADLDIAEKRMPQDGRIKRVVDGVDIDLRISTLPTHFGEKTVIRILRHTADLFSLDSLGFVPDEISHINDIITRPQGIIFVTGPTGSGKSSSLFAFLNKIKEKDINITTIENPIEIKLSGINQVQVNEKAGLTFAATLRSILRQDPDVILIGEIRDHETAEIAVQSAQTGHLVFSTLHTNDSSSAITRLKDLGVPPFMIASSIITIMAQRLVRRLCVHCRKEYTPSDELVFKFKHLYGDIPLPQSYHSLGCPKCGNTGFEGRIGVFEFLKLDNDIRQLIIAGKSDIEIKQMAVEKGMRTLAFSGLDKVKAGMTSLEELMRVVAG